jgi:hypothetical protein
MPYGYGKVLNKRGADCYRRDTVMPKKGSGYVSVTIPEEIERDIEKIKRLGHGYQSKGDVVEDAVRRLLLILVKKPLEVRAE